MIKLKKNILSIQLSVGLVLTGTIALAADPAAPPRQQMGKLETKATNNYVHSWKKFPVIKGKSIFNDEEIVVRPEKGTANIVIFLSSSNIPTQQLIGDLLELEKKYTPLHTKFYYIFTADLKADASGFAREFKMNSYNALLANNDILKKFKNPGPPTIYIADRRGWFADRFKKIDRKNIRQIDYILARMTAN